MLIELTIRNFAVIQETRIELARGLNALTGETGAGKSIVIDALSAVLGARTSAEFVRSGERGAYVEAVFDISDLPDPAPVQAMLAELGVEVQPDEPLVLSRDVSASGRSTARVGGRTVTAAALAQLGELLVDIHGQSDHLSLLRPASQLDLLDRFAGTLPQRDEVATAYRDWQALRRRVHDFDVEQRTLAQRLDLLRFQSEELGNAGIRPGEDEQLQQERTVLANAERLIRSAAEAESALNGDATGATLDAGALDRVRAATRSLDDAIQLDPTLEPTLTKLNDALFALEDVVVELRDYAERTELDPLRLEQVDERLDLLRRLKRKYGPELSDVIEHAEQIQQELESIEAGEHDIDALRSEEASQRSQLARLAWQLSEQRKAAATTLAKRVEQAIAELNMGRASFEVRFDTTPSPDGVPGPDAGDPVAIDATGYDRIAFYLAANAGEELRPLARVASGGETARLMLALKSILSDADDTPILVFDEVDVGVGGRSGQVVGEKLWSLTDKHQAIVISHLSQIAAFADRHLVLVKDEVDARTVTTARPVEGDERVEELAAMLDGLPPTPESRANAGALLQRVNAWKDAARGGQSRPKKRR
ncbi:MAG TPA: DNA repair protein RecN [Thermomicrobiales bacterium]|nr:DNA repair protein RecN [Thermomicrobiales bacterium]